MVPKEDAVALQPGRMPAGERQQHHAMKAGAATPPAGPPGAACQTSRDLTSSLQTHRTPGLLQGDKAPQHEFYQPKLEPSD